MKEEKPEAKLYKTGLKEVSGLEKGYAPKANMIQKAYEAAVAELGYSDKELLDRGKARMVAKVMFSDKYLGNEKFNPLLKGYKGFAEKSDLEKQRDYKQMLDMNLDTFVSNGGLIDGYGGLKRAAMASAVERHYDSHIAQQMTSWAWMKAYDPQKSLAQNIESYANIIRQDPILAQTGAKLDAGKFQSLEDAAQTLATSLTGNLSRDTLQYRHGVDFN
ncbi:hypothetical protein KY363_02225 [Candidatus Woesearchaeota archaeon]|nr:hypothetical protein [Candidatus Woesearchaeota archaeon]